MFAYWIDEVKSTANDVEDVDVWRGKGGKSERVKGWTEAVAMAAVNGTGSRLLTTWVGVGETWETPADDDPDVAELRIGAIGNVGIVLDFDKVLVICIV